MHRYRGQKALYEAIKRSQERMRHAQVEPLHPEAEPETPQVKAPAKTEKPPSSETNSRHSRWQRPRPVQINEGRLEFALPIPVVFVVVLAFFLCILGIFRYGRHAGQASVKQIEPPQAARDRSGNQPSPVVERQISPHTVSQNDLGPVTTGPLALDSEDMETTGPGNAIVIMNWGDRTQLMPLQEHFARYGIETEIKTLGSRYILVSKKRFTKDPKTMGTKGFQHKQKMIELGKQYKAPPGNLNFAPRSFEGAYGILLND